MFFVLGGAEQHIADKITGNNEKSFNRNETAGIKIWETMIDNYHHHRQTSQRIYSYDMLTHNYYYNNKRFIDEIKGKKFVRLIFCAFCDII